MELLRSIAVALMTPVLLGAGLASAAEPSPVVYRMAMTPDQSLRCTFTEKEITCFPDFPVTWKGREGQQANTLIISLIDAHITTVDAAVKWDNAPAHTIVQVTQSTSLEGFDVTLTADSIIVEDAYETAALITPDSYELVGTAANVSAT